MQPMLATLADAPLRDPHLVYEPKYDGIRAIVTVTPGAKAATVSIASRLGNDKTEQFPEIVRALEAWARARRDAVVLDGEIVALDEAGQPLGFGSIQPRIHLTGGKDVARRAATQPVALYVFDLLREGAEDLCKLPLVERRQRLEATLGALGEKNGPIRLSRQVTGDGEALMAEAQAEGWEGLIVYDAGALHRLAGAWPTGASPGSSSGRSSLSAGGPSRAARATASARSFLLGPPAVGGKLRYVGARRRGILRERVADDRRAARAPRAEDPFLRRCATLERQAALDQARARRRGALLRLDERQGLAPTSSSAWCDDASCFAA